MESAKLNAAVIQFLEQILKEWGAKPNCHYKIENATEKGENFIGILYRITADIPDEIGQIKKFSCLVKVSPSNPARRKQFFARPCFLREALAYEEFLPLSESFQLKQNNACIEKSFHEYPKCFGSITTEFDEAIFMENMNLKSFKLFDRFKEMDMEHVAFVMRAYGKLHAVSLALKEQDPQKLKPFQGIIDIFEQRKDDEKLGAYFEHLKTLALKSLDFENHKKYYKVLKIYLDKQTFFALLLTYLKPDDCEPYAVICHGDCWNNNFLFKYEQNNVIDVCVIDWQLMRYGSPVLDLMYFIFINTTSEFRKRHYAEALNIYYDELSAHLRRLGSDPQKLFPRGALDNQLKCKGAIGLLLSMIVLPVVTLKSEDTPDLEKLSEQIESGEKNDLNKIGFISTANDNLYEKRMRDVIIDVIDYGYLF